MIIDALGFAMDPAALHMMADLGLERRDTVSAPNFTLNGRRGHVDPLQRATVARAFEDRRNSSRNQHNGVRTARLKAWNSKHLQPH